MLRIKDPRGNKRRSFLAGLATPNPRGDVLGAVQSGLGGALGYGQQQADLERQLAAEQIKRDMEERQFGLEQRKVGAQELSAEADMRRAQREPGTSGAGVSFEDWQHMTPEQQSMYGKFKNITDNPRQPSEFDRWLQMTPAEREQYGQFKNVGDNPNDPLMYTETDVLERDLGGLPSRTRSKRIRRSDLLRMQRQALTNATPDEFTKIISDPNVLPEVREEAQRRMMQLPNPAIGRREDMRQ